MERPSGRERSDQQFQRIERHVSGQPCGFRLNPGTKSSQRDKTEAVYTESQPQNSTSSEMPVLFT
jgi:hypothetical protein